MPKQQVLYNQQDFWLQDTQIDTIPVYNQKNWLQAPYRDNNAHYYPGCFYMGRETRLPDGPFYAPPRISNTRPYVSIQASVSAEEVNSRLAVLYSGVSGPPIKGTR